MKNVLLCLATFAAVPNAWAQDGCSTALPTAAGTHTVTAVNGPEIPFPICAFNGVSNTTASEWYSYTPTDDFALTITTEASGLDTRFHIYTGACGALTCVGGDDDSGTGNTSLATLNVTQGITYLIAFDNRWSSSGFQFQLIEQDPVVLLVSFHAEPITVTGYASCVVDMNGDHLDDVVGTNSTNINIHHQQAGGGFLASNYTTTEADYTPSWSIAAGDIDGNGFNDLLYAGSGVTFMMANATATAYTEVSFPQYVFCQRSNMVDINMDGNLDAFVCHDVEPNVFYMNDGTGNLTYYQGGLGDTPDGGNYGSIWIDYDGDHDIDLFIAKCRGGNGPAKIDQLHRNNGDGTWTEIGAAMNLADGHQSWSSAWGDFDNDGDMDILIGASSFSGGGHKLMRNDGTTFTNVSAGSAFDTFTGTSIEFTAHDFNNDGYVDVLGAGALHLNNGDMTFTRITVSAYNGPVGDLNNDGFLDLLNGNTLQLNDGNENHYLKVNTIGTASNSNGIGARVQVTSALGTQIRDVKAGDGFEYMSSLTTHFGLGPDTEVSEVVVYWPSGIVQTISDPAIDGTLDIVEGVFTGADDQVLAPGLMIFPNPAADVLNISADRELGTAPVAVFDATGKRVITSTLLNGRLDVSGLSTGVYLLEVNSGDGLLHRRFTKQ